MRRFSSSDEGRLSSMVAATGGQVRSTPPTLSTSKGVCIGGSDTSSAQLISPGGCNTIPSSSSHPTSSSSKRSRIGATPLSVATTATSTHCKELSKANALMTRSAKASTLQVGGSATESPLSLQACCAGESIPATPLRQPPSTAWLPTPPPHQQRADDTISLDSGTAIAGEGALSPSISPVAKEAHASILSYLHKLSTHSKQKPTVDDSIVEMARLEDRYEVCGKVGSGSHSIVYHVQRERRSRGAATTALPQPHEDTATSTIAGSSSNNHTALSSLRRRKVSFAAKVISLLSHTLEEVLTEVNISLKLQFNSCANDRNSLCIPKIYKIIIAPDGTNIVLVMELLKGGELFKEVSNLSPSASRNDEYDDVGMVSTPAVRSGHIPRPATTLVACHSTQERQPPATGPTPSTSYTVNTTGAGGGRLGGGHTTPPPSISYLPSVHSSGGGSGMFLRSSSGSMGGASRSSTDDAPSLPSKTFSSNNQQLLCHQHGDYTTVPPPGVPPVLSPRELLVRHYLWDVLHALCTFHEAGIAHRDIKLENIVQITPPTHIQQPLGFGGALLMHDSPHHRAHQPLVKVIDFGFARDISPYCNVGGRDLLRKEAQSGSVPPSPMISYTPTRTTSTNTATTNNAMPPSEPTFSFEMLPPITPPRRNSSSVLHTNGFISPNERAPSFTRSTAGGVMMMASRSSTPLVLGGSSSSYPVSVSPSPSPSPSRSMPRARPDRPFVELVGSSQYVAPEALRASRFKSSSASATPQRGVSPQSNHSPSPQGGGFGTPLFSPSTPTPTPLPGAFSRQAASGGYGREVDVWAAGVCLYTLLFGKYPFTAQRSSHQHRNIMSGKYSIPTYLAKASTALHSQNRSGSSGTSSPSSECLQLLRQMLTIDPDARITAAEALVHPWFALCSPVEKHM